MSDAALEAKFTDLATGILPPSQAQALMRLCWTIEQVARRGRHRPRRRDDLAAVIIGIGIRAIPARIRLRTPARRPAGGAISLLALRLDHGRTL